MRMFFGMISSASSGGSFWRRVRLRSATATARLAAAWPTTYLSSSSDDFARGHVVECEGLVFGGAGEVDGHAYALALSSSIVMLWLE